MSAFVDFFSGHDPPSFGPWLELSEIPLAEELTAEQSPKLPLNEFEERHQLKDQYLETQYRLHRYEATEPLRRAIYVYRQQFSLGQTDVELESVNIYTKVNRHSANPHLPTQLNSMSTAACAVSKSRRLVSRFM